jgi:predicted metal-dependent phosphoesterase TrpH
VRIDLHTHTTASDGELEPMQLCRRAASRGVELLSITDHDTCSAYHELGALVSLPIQLIPGIEFSTYWQSTGIHILGLKVELQNEVLKSAIEYQQKARALRAEQIAARLERYGIENSLPQVKQIAGNTYIGRPHFAQHLVNIGRVKNVKEAFKKLLGPGKPGDVKENWAPMTQIIDWIREAGGTAVLAHPAKYGLTWSRLGVLLDAFSKAGGQGMEVISGQQQPDLTNRLAKLSVQKGMLASCGSDFHRPEDSWSEVGHISGVPAECKPVWHNWDYS